ncbi:MAG: PQQ-binding-like beta-propeller repeat protein [Planctomycetaceae bacterium]
MKVGILWAFCDATCFAQQRPAAELSAIQKHGLPEVLSQHLFRDRQIELLLRSAESGRDRGNAELMRESLLLIFAHPHDVFELNSESQSVISLQSRARLLLLQSSRELQQTWVDANRVISEQELESAIRRGGRREAARVAREFPLTEAGLQAQVIDLTCELLKGDSRKVAVQVRQLDEMYSGTVLHAELQQQLRPLVAKLTGLNTSDEASHSARLSFSASASSGTIAPPWPQPLWTWREGVWNFPGVPQPDAGILLSAFDPAAENRIDSFSNWRPVFWNDSIVIRTPFRIIALDRASGREHWSLPTDTFKPQLDAVYNELEDATRGSMNDSNSSLDTVAPIHGMAEFGLMASDRDFLYFIDRFSFFSGTDPFFENSVDRVIRNRNGFPIIEEHEETANIKPVASRLVALRGADGAVPTVAWQVGDGQTFQYGPVAKVDSIQSSTPALSSGAHDTETAALEVSGDAAEVSDKTWSGHRFLSPPTGEGTRLFVLTQSDTQVYLNCLQRSTGSLLWRQPLAYTDDKAPAFPDKSIFTKRTSTCVISGETIVCSLADGMLIGVRAIDGTLQWATAIRDEESLTPEIRFGWQMPTEETAISSPSILVPCVSDGIVVCGNHASVSLYGLSLESGEILWKRSRRAFGAGEVGGSPDYYVVGICGHQVIMIGDRHCRSVELKTGEQNWVVQIPAASGRAECRGDRCVIPLRYGQALTVNLTSGTLIPPSVVDAPEKSMDQYGAVVSDDDLICVSTPTCLAVYPRVDALLKNTDHLPALTANPTKRTLIQAQAHLINGDEDAALALLKTAVAVRSSDTPTSPQIDEFLAELILQQWGVAIGSGREGLQSLPPGQSDLPGAEVPSDAELLSQLKLPADMELRASVFQLLSETFSDRRSHGLAELRQNRDWNKSIRLTNQWSVLPELLFNELSSDLQGGTPALEELSNQELRQLVGHTLRHPETMPDDASRQQLANRLISRREYAAAELFLIRWCEVSANTRSTSYGQAFDVLQQLRTLRDTNVYRSRPVLTDENDDSEQMSPDIIRTESPQSGITSMVSVPLSFEMHPFIRRPDAEFEATQRQVWSDPLPKHSGMNTYLSSDADASSKLISIDPLDGSVRDQIDLPFPINQTAGRFVPLADGDLTPALFPVCSTDEIAMLSCPIPGKAGILWTRHFRNGEKDALRVEFGPLGSDHFIWHFSDELHCSDPLTGNDLWTRKRTLSQSDQTIMDRGTNPSVRRIAGDRQAMIVMGSDSRSYERFNTRDGRLLGAGRLAIGKSESVVTVGRCLLYTDANARLHLFDSASGKDELEDDEPILPLNRDGRTICQVLENNRVLVVSATLDLILIDVDQGRVIFTTPASTFVKSGFVFSCSAFERHGRMFAALSGEGRSVRTIQQAYGRGAPLLSNGPLLCLDPVTGDVEWSVHVEQAVFPEVLGDPTDLLVSWSAPEASLESNMSYQSEDKLVVQIFDETTGQLISRSPVYSSLPPLRCVHHADESLIQLTTPNATISIRASAADSAPFP